MEGCRDACPMRSFEFREDRCAKNGRLRGMPRCGRHLGASSPLPGVRARRLLRRLEEQARHQAFQEDRASDHHLARAGGGLVMVLRGRDRHRAWMSGETSFCGETLSYSATFPFHLIPGITETTTRLPLGAPLLPNADAPALQAATAVLLVAFLIGATLQVLRLRARRRPAS